MKAAPDTGISLSGRSSNRGDVLRDPLPLLQAVAFGEKRSQWVYARPIRRLREKTDAAYSASCSDKARRPAQSERGKAAADTVDERDGHRPSPLVREPSRHRLMRISRYRR